MSCTIGITLGDVTGIGPEVSFKALSNVPLDDTRYVVIGDGGRVRRLSRDLASFIHFVPYDPAKLDRF